MPKQRPSNCLVCILRPVLHMGRLTMSIVHFECPHRNKNAKKATMKRSKALSLLCFLITLLAMALSFLKIGQLINSASAHACMLALNGFISCLRLINLTLFGNLNAHLKISELNALSSLIDDRGRYEIKNFLSVKTTKKAIIGATSVLSLLILIDVIGCGYMMYGADNMEVLQELVLNLCTLVHIGGVFHLITMGLLYKHLFNVCFFKLKRALNDNVDETSLCNKITYMKLYHGRSKLQLLHKLKELYTKLHRCFTLHKKFSEDILLWSFNLFMVMFINTTFLTVMGFLDRLPKDKYFIMMIAQSSGSYLAIELLLATYERLGRVNEDITSFLFRYPLSKLSAAEAAQVEMIMATLQIQKPILRASDIFTVGNRLLASISGTVVTYLLVALQFHASWGK